MTIDTARDLDRRPASRARPAVLTGIVVNHTHWDREWYMPFQRYRVLLVDAVDRLFDILAHQPDYRGFLLDGQTVVAEDYLEVRPEQRDVLAHYIAQGRITLGPWYVLPDEFLPSGESLIRNLLLGRRQMQALGAPAARVGYLPDTFGHPAQLPQILAGFDLESAVIFRGVQSDTSEFLWEAPDGTRLLTIYLPGGYYNGMELARAPEFWLAERMPVMLDQVARFATTPAVLIMNGCDHFEPQPATQAFLDRANALQDRVHLRQGSLEEYVELVRAARPALSVKTGEWRYNRPSRITPGVLSSRMYLKQADFRASTALERGAEPLQALAWGIDGHHDTGLLDTAWRYLLQNHPHDSICGCSVDAVHRDDEARFRWSQEITGDLIERAANRLAARLGVPGPGFAAFNTLAAPRTEVVRQRLHFLAPGMQFALADGAGRAVAHQEVARRPMPIEWDPQRQHFLCQGRQRPAVVVSPPAPDMPGARWRRWEGEEVEILFQADLPGGGYSTIRVVPAAPETALAPTPAALPLDAGATWLENAWLRVDAAPDGSLTLTDKLTGRQYGPLHVFRTEADRGDEYTFCPAEADAPVGSRSGQATIALVEAGPLRATLEVRLTLDVPTRLAPDRRRRVAETVALPIVSRIALSPGSRRLEFQTTLQNTAEDQRLRVLFGTGVQTAWADAQGQFEVTRRAVELPAEERARVPLFDEEQEVSYHPQRAFVDVSDAAGGLAVLNRGLPEYEAEPGVDGVTLGLTLLRAVGRLSRDDLSTRYKHAGPPLDTPDAQCLGPHTFEYAVVPHAGDWLATGIPAQAAAYTTPVYSAALPAGSASSDAPARGVFYELGPQELIFSACKRSEDGRSLVLRAYNTAPYSVEGVLQLPGPARVCRANLAEREIDPPLREAEAPSGPGPRAWHFPVHAREIVTLRIEPAAAPAAAEEATL